MADSASTPNDDVRIAFSTRPWPAGSGSGTASAGGRVVRVSAEAATLIRDAVDPRDRRLPRSALPMLAQLEAGDEGRTELSVLTDALRSADVYVR